jgi:uncharacterized Zn finger protein
MDCPLCETDDVICEFVHMLDGSGRYRCNTCGHTWIDNGKDDEIPEDRQVKVKYFIVTVNNFSYEYKLRVTESEFWTDEFTFYHDDKEMYVQNDGVNHYIELFLKIDTPDSEIKELEKEAKRKLVENFNKRIEHFNKLIGGVNKECR